MSRSSTPRSSGGARPEQATLLQKTADARPNALVLDRCGKVEHLGRYEGEIVASYPWLAEIEAGSTRELSDVLERIRLISGIRSTETNIHLASYR